MNIKTVKELKEFLKDLPDDMEVSSCCSSSDGCGVQIRASSYNIDDELNEMPDYDYVWIGYNEK